MTIKVKEWPKIIKTEDGRTIVNPTRETCEAMGYSLYTEEELAAIEQEQQEQHDKQIQLEAERITEVEVLRESYRNITQQLCMLAGVPVQDKFESMFDIQSIGENIADPEARIAFMQGAFTLQALIVELRRKDGDDAWERI